ncbi:hypothetical protein [Klebsiella quasipneumoniae]
MAQGAASRAGRGWCGAPKQTDSRTQQLPQKHGALDEPRSWAKSG